MIRLILVLFSILTYKFVPAQLFPNLVFQKFYDNLGDDYAKKLLKSHDGNIFIGGNTVLFDSTGEDCSNIWIVKVDTLGELLWEQEITMTGCEELRDMVNTEDGGIMFTGVTNSLIPHRERGDEDYWGDYFIGKMDSIGTVEWLQSYGGSNLDQAFGIVKGIYREFMIAGGSHSYDGDVGINNGMSDVWALKIDTKGQPRFSKVLGGLESDWANAVALCQNGDYLFAGFSNSPQEIGRQDLYGGGLVIRMTQTGRIVWQKSFSCPLGGYFTRVAENDQGKIILTGTMESGKNGKDFWYVRLDENGQQLSEHIQNRPDDEILTSMVICDDRGFLMGGYSTSLIGGDDYAKGGDDFWLIRTNSIGGIVWQNTYGGPNDERCQDVLEYRPGVYFAVGEKHNMFTRDSDSQDMDFWFLRIEEYPTDSINASIYVRAEENRINRNTPTRFRARYSYGDRFLWDFGDGTTSTEESPLKTYEISGLYEVTLTVFANENCQQTVKLEDYIEVW